LSEAAHVVGATPTPPSRRRGGVVAGAVSARSRLVAVLPNGQDDAVYWLESQQVDIGRLQGDLRFADPQLAPRHARLNLTLGGAMITPLDGRNGVYLRIRSIVELIDGDHILLGRQVMRFELVPDHERRPRPAVEDGVVLFGTPTSPAWARLRQMTSSGLGRDVVHLSRPDLTLGREQADLVFGDDEFLSRRHAQVSLKNGRPILADLESSNGTYVRLRSPHVLVPGDMIRLGDQLLRFELG
jgi:pSer/pThr/pTyr-binding forkhead associated (FHA) protein